MKNYEKANCLIGVIKITYYPAFETKEKALMRQFINDCSYINFLLKSSLIL